MCKKWKVNFEADKFDSGSSDLRIVDNTPESIDHPQGALTIATVNIRAFAPHIEEALANARLIAAAPELLEACTNALHRIETDIAEDTELICALKLAIAKANQF